MTGIIDILKEFSLEEVKSLERFLYSPYHNKSKKLLILFREIIKFYPAFNNKKLTKEYLSKKITPFLKYNDSTFRNLTADLQIQIEKFLISEQVFQYGYEKNILLLRSLLEKKQNHLFEINLNKTAKLLEKEGFDNTYHYIKSRLDIYAFNNNIINKGEKSAQNVENNVEIINSYIINLVNFFITETINSHLKLVIEEFKFNIKEKANFSSELIESIDLNKISRLIKRVNKDNFILDLYLNLFLSFRYIEEKQYYLKYRSLIAKFYKRLSNDELSYHYSMLISYCVIKNTFSVDKLFYDNELFGIYSSFLKKKLFIDKKSCYLDEVLYRNILVLSLRLKKFAWTLDFITNYSKYLHPSKSKNMGNLSRAEYYYHLGSTYNSAINLNKAFNYLKEIREELFIIKYDIKILYLMLYYDLGYMENLLTLVSNYRKFLSRNSLVPKEKRKKLYGFLNILERLAFLKEGNPNIDITKINLDIFKLKKFNYQNWLLDKVQVFNVKTSYIKLKHG